MRKSVYRGTVWRCTYRELSFAFIAAFRSFRILTNKGAVAGAGVVDEDVHRESSLLGLYLHRATNIVARIGQGYPRSLRNNA